MQFAVSQSDCVPTRAVIRSIASRFWVSHNARFTRPREPAVSGGYPDRRIFQQESLKCL
jgi:hypothetical protein